MPDFNTIARGITNKKPRKAIGNTGSVDTNPLCEHLSPSEVRYKEAVTLALPQRLRIDPYMMPPDLKPRAAAPLSFLRLGTLWKAEHLAIEGPALGLQCRWDGNVRMIHVDRIQRHAGSPRLQLALPAQVRGC